MTRTGEEQGGAIYPSQEEDERGPNVYFDTDDIESSLEQVRDARRSRRREDADPAHRLVRRTAATPRATTSASSRATSRSSRRDRARGRSRRPRGARGLGPGRGDGPLRHRASACSRRSRSRPACSSCSRWAILLRRPAGHGRSRRRVSGRRTGCGRGRDGAGRRAHDHVRPAAHRHDGDDRDPDRRPARDGRGDRPLRPLRRRPDRDHLAACASGSPCSASALRCRSSK